MWWNQTPPWMQGMGQGGQPGMTPGAGMPPYRNAPMNMNPVQMGPPGSIPVAPPPAAQQGQRPVDPAQMGMLAAMLAQQTQKPMTSVAQRAAAAGATGVGGPLPGGAAAVPAGAAAVPAGAAAVPAGMDPSQLGMLAQFLARQGILGGLGR